MKTNQVKEVRQNVVLIKQVFSGIYLFLFSSIVIEWVRTELAFFKIVY